MNHLARWQGMIVLAWGLSFAAISACSQTILSNANLAAFSNALITGGKVTLDFDGTITVTNCLTITNSVTLDGNGHTVTISGGSNSEIFAVATNASLVLQTLTIADGLSINGSPGTITNDGVLTAYDCVFRNNSSQSSSTLVGVSASGGAIVNLGLLLASNSSFIQNSAIGGGGYSSGAPGLGGAIYNAGTALVTDCTFSINSAIGGFGFDYVPGSGGEGQGGAIFNSGAIIVSNSTFFQNLCSGGVGGTGSGAYPWAAAGPGAQGGNGGGGAIYSAAGSTIVVNSTFLSTLGRKYGDVFCG